MKLLSNKLERCPNGHLFDSARYSQCPYCNPETARGLESTGTTRLKLDEINSMLENLPFAPDPERREGERDMAMCYAPRLPEMRKQGLDAVTQFLEMELEKK